MRRAILLMAALALAGCGTLDDVVVQPAKEAVAIYCTPKTPRKAAPYADAADQLAKATSIDEAAKMRVAGEWQRDARILSLETDLAACSGGKWQAH